MPRIARVADRLTRRPQHVARGSRSRLGGLSGADRRLSRPAHRPIRRPARTTCRPTARSSAALRPKQPLRLRRGSPERPGTRAARMSARARTAAFSAGRMSRWSSAIPATQPGRFPAWPPQGELPTVRLERAAVAQAIARPIRRSGWRRIQQALDMNRLYRPGLRDARVASGPRGVRPGSRAAQRPRSLRPASLRPGAAARPPAGRGGRAVYQRHLEPHRTAARTSSRTTPTSTAGTRTTTSSTRCKDRLLPRFDQSFSALIEDLDQRGLLDQTLVVCMGEFGRAPRVALEPKFAGATPGRKHWATVYSIVLAGAGVAARRGRRRLGPTRRRAGHRALRPVGRRRHDVSRPGHRPPRPLHRLVGRPYPITTGRPIEAIYSTS